MTASVGRSRAWLMPVLTLSDRTSRTQIVVLSEPVPVAHMTGASAAMVVTTVMIFGRTRSTAPCMVAS